MTTSTVARRRTRKQGQQTSPQADDQRAEAPAPAPQDTPQTPAPAATAPEAEQDRAALAAANAGPELPSFCPTNSGTFFFWAAVMDERGVNTAYRIKAVAGGWSFAKP